MRARPLELLAHLADEDVDRAVAVGHRVAPDRLVDLLALEDLALGLGEQLQHLELAPREVDAAAADEGLELIGADLELARHERPGVDPCRGPLAAADHGLDAGEHLLGMAGLGDPVVGAERAARARAAPRSSGPCRPRCPGPGRAAETRSRKSQAPGPSRARSTTSALTRMATNSSVRGGASRRRYCQPRSPARLTSTRTKPESESRIARRRSDIRGGVYARHPDASPCAFTGFSQPDNARDNGHSAHSWNSRRAMEAAMTERASPGRATLEIRPAEFVAVLDGERLALTVRELELLTALAERTTASSAARSSTASFGASPTASPTARWTCTWASCGRSSSDARPDRQLIHTHFGFGYRLPRTMQPFTPFSQGGDRSDNRLLGGPLRVSPPQ